MREEPSDPVATIERLIGVYNADGTLRGEVRYWIGARLAKQHCALCDITHGSFREKSQWKQCRAALPVPFDTYHRDDQPQGVRALLGAAIPAVVAQTTAGFVLLVGPSQLERCQGSPERLAESIVAIAHERGLIWIGASAHEG